MRIVQLVVLPVLVFIVLSIFSNSCQAQSEKAVFLIQALDGGGKVSGQGTGFFIDSKGVGITSTHVFKNAFKVQLVSSDSVVYSVTKILYHDLERGVVRFLIDNPQNNSFATLSINNGVTNKGEKVSVIRAVEPKVSKKTGS